MIANCGENGVISFYVAVSAFLIIHPFGCLFGFGYFQSAMLVLALYVSGIALLHRDQKHELWEENSRASKLIASRLRPATAGLVLLQFIIVWTLVFFTSPNEYHAVVGLAVATIPQAIFAIHYFFVKSVDDP